MWEWLAVGAAIWIGAVAFAALAVTRVGTDVVSQGSIPMSYVAIIFAWLAGFAALAAISVRGTAEKI